ncbi:hypothetical protein [Erythrobacter sp. HL-111]|uniref:hypothetical protein n=1 Tax=Erythrobacter sp. HL-111 TaxID=1798193 RepID=UPI0006DAEFA7|nr:hypothetical protein [Erythrobacter sp. HL-111]KPP92918.1 MAG: hypothetical protein HLUCCO15_07155 [Erythrobacteraceae bacterium HL-111]SDT01748.1 hypothetical protein SAMN04515621_2725 [Erythrobacter sp. HL-111]
MSSHLKVSAALAASIALVGTGGIARAEEGTGPMSAEPGLVRLVFGDHPNSAGRVIEEPELADLRGGYRGVYFELFGYGDLSRMGGTLPDGVEIASQSADLVSLSVGLATLPNTGGFAQFASVVGDNNVVNNNLVLNVYFLDGGVADTSNIRNGGIFGL